MKYTIKSEESRIIAILILHTNKITAIKVQKQEAVF